ncbi:MAG TPA: 6-bladed beta-propeller [Edaphocola sp.]|nr:6-bladed beta-propeller [Edaphocola sp.]
MKTTSYFSAFLIFSIFLMLVFNSCNRNKPHSIKLENNIDTKIISFEDIPPASIKASSILDSLDFIILDFEKAGFIDDINKVVFHNDEFYVFDSKQQLILIFDLDGTFLRKIAKQGRGPGEYPFLSDFTVQGDTILILNRNVIYKYDISGVFIESISIEFIPSNIECSNQFYYFFRRGNVDFNDKEYYYDLIKCDTKGNIINMYFPFGKDSTYEISTDSPFYRSGGELYYISGGRPNITHTVYSLSDQYIHPYSKYEIRRESPRSFIVGDFFETESTLMFNVFCEKNPSKVIISKLDSTAIVYNKVDLDSQFLFVGGSTKFSHDSYFLTKFDPFEFGAYIKNNKQFKDILIREYPKYKAFFKYIENENINPVFIKEYYKPRLMK